MSHYIDQSCTLESHLDFSSIKSQTIIGHHHKNHKNLTGTSEYVLFFVKQPFYYSNLPSASVKNANTLCWNGIQ